MKRALGTFVASFVSPSRLIQPSAADREGPTRAESLANPPGMAMWPQLTVKPLGQRSAASSPARDSRRHRSVASTALNVKRCNPTTPATESATTGPSPSTSPSGR